MAKPRSRDSGRFRIYTSDRSGFEFGFQPITNRPNPYTREAGKPVKDLNINVSPNEFDQPPPSSLPLGGQGDVNQGNIRANSNFDTSSNAFVVPPESQNVVNYITPAGIDANTVLMLHMNGANGSTSFPDASFSNKTITANSGATIATAQSEFGGSSALFIASSGSFLSTPNSTDFDFRDGDFTVDFWLKPNSFSDFLGTQGLFSKFQTFTNFMGFYMTASDMFIQFKSSGVLLVNYQTRFGAISTTNWQHVAIVRNNASAFVFVNGLSNNLLVSTAFGTNKIPSYTGNVEIGRMNPAFNPIENVFDGYMQELRVTKGVARWTSNFTPPNAPYSATNSTIPLTNNYPPLSMTNQPIINEPILISGSLNTVSMAVNPQISLGAQSQQISLECVGSSVTLLNGSGLTLNTSNSTQFVMNSGSIINFMYQTSNNTWFETSRSILYSDAGNF